MGRVPRWVAVVVLVGACTAAPISVPASTATTGATLRPTQTVPSTTAAAPTAANASPIVTMAEHFFDPAILVVAAGTTVTWKDLGQQLHDVNARDGSFRSPLLGPGGTFSFTFTKPGRYSYFCSLHEGDGMIGEVDVQ